MSLWGVNDNKTSSGNVNVFANGTVFGNGTDFSNEAAVGDYIVIDSTNEHFLITSIADNTTLTVIPGTPGVTQGNVDAASDYALTEKPIYVATTVSTQFGEGAANVYGVSIAEAAANVDQGMAHAGWVKRMVSPGPGGVGTRVRYETLVAMSGITGDAADDSVLLDFFAAFLAQPSAATANLIADANATATFSVTTQVRPENGNVQYYWQESTDSGANWANISNTVLYTGFQTNELTINEPTGFDTYEYRVKVWAGDAGTGFAEITSSNVILTVVGP
jgi:hypothetical protein